MRLLDTSSVELHEFHGEAIPAYAILSHTWGEDEVSFQALQKRNRPPYRAIISRGGVREEFIIEEVLDRSDEEGQGWQKIKNCCALAARRGHKYVWIDTCCINKESSAELTESINSMFRWYRDATVCFAYFGDFHSGPSDLRAPESAFRRSRWFTRGWTLQELLAPRVLEFFSADWQSVGTRVTLGDLIVERTGIGSLRHWQLASVAAKMSWASRRDCCRVEDVAYSLLGLFGINMPLLYGEGKRAFKRLQLEILKESTDESIFAWTIETYSFGLLADSPRDFADSGDVKVLLFDNSRPHYSMTNMGLKIEASLLKSDKRPHLTTIPLNCTSLNARSWGVPNKNTFPFPLIVMKGSHTTNTFFRMKHQYRTLSESEWREIWEAHVATNSNSQTATKITRHSIYLGV